MSGIRGRRDAQDEPGLYQPGHWGARIEGIVLVTGTDVEPLDHRPHELHAIP